MLDRCRHQRGLGREVVDLGAARETGALGYARGRRVDIPVLDEAVDGGVQQGRLGRRPPLRLRTAGLPREAFAEGAIARNATCERG